MWHDALGQLLSAAPQASRDGGTREIVGYHAVLTDPTMLWLGSPRRCLSPYYWAAEVLWYASGTDRTEMIERYAPQYHRFAVDHVAHGAYGRRINGHGQLENVIEELRERPDTRRAVLALWWPGDIRAAVLGTPDVPCTTQWQFLARDGRLHMFVNMRSQDVWLGLPYDVAWTCLVQQLVARELGLALGWYHHSVASLHVYDRNYQGACDAYYEGTGESGQVVAGQGETYESLRAASANEQVTREGRDDIRFEPMGIIGRSLYGLCRHHLTGQDLGIPCQALAAAAGRYLERHPRKERES